MPLALRIDLSDIFSKYETILFKLISAMLLFSFYSDNQVQHFCGSDFKHHTLVVT